MGGVTPEIIMSKNYNDKVVSCTLPDEEKSQLEWLAKLEGVTMSQMIRDIIISYLNNNNISRQILDFALKTLEEEYKHIELDI